MKAVTRFARDAESEETVSSGRIRSIALGSIGVSSSSVLSSSIRRASSPVLSRANFSSSPLGSTKGVDIGTSSVAGG